MLGLMVCVELLTGLEAETGVLLTGGCCFFLRASYGGRKGVVRGLLTLWIDEGRDSIDFDWKVVVSA